MKVVPLLLCLFVVFSHNFVKQPSSGQDNPYSLVIETSFNRAQVRIFSQDDLSFMLSSEHSYEVIYLLRQLQTRLVETPSGVTTFLFPERDVHERVSLRLIEIARQSPEDRAMVIKALAQIVDDPGAPMELPFASRWHTAVRLLADLKAVEAIDVLVRNICETGQPVVIISLHHRPVFSSIIRIGRPAVPRLILALSDDYFSIRREAAYALSAIGGNKAKEALEQAFEIETEEDVLKAISTALTTIAYSNPIAD